MAHRLTPSRLSLPTLRDLSWPQVRPLTHHLRLLAVSTAEIQALDLQTIETVGIPRLLLMEHAGMALAHVACRLWLTLPRSRRAASPPIVICAGSGYNGGDGLCAARHLSQAGCRVRVLLSGSQERLAREPRIYADILRSTNVPVSEISANDAETALARAGIIVDALLGVGLRGPVRPSVAALIHRINAARRPIVSADIPSGLDADTGAPQGVAVMATSTVTFGLPKRGLLIGQGPRHAGRVEVADIGIPRRLMTRLAQ